MIFTAVFAVVAFLNFCLAGVMVFLAYAVRKRPEEDVKGLAFPFLIGASTVLALVGFGVYLCLKVYGGCG